MSARKTLAAAIAAIATVGVGLSLTIPLLSLRMEAAGYSARAIGINTALGAVATFFVAPLVPRAARLLGVRALMLGALGLGILSLFAFGLTADIALWFPIRLMFGAALTVLFVMSEYWINAAAPPERRGLVMGVYATALALGFALGPALLSLSGTAGLLPFALGAALFALAALPVLLGGADAPELQGRGAVPLKAFLAAVPVATMAALTFGAIETGVMGLLPVYAVDLHLSPEQGALCVSLFALGSVLFEIPLGLLSDRVDRRLLLLGIALGGFFGALAAPLAATSFAGLAILLLAWGGLVGGLYPVGLAHLGSRSSGAELATANAAFVMFYSAGMLVGPPLLGAAMDAMPPHGLFAAMAAVFALYAALVLGGLRRSAGAGP